MIGKKPQRLASWQTLQHLSQNSRVTPANTLELEYSNNAFTLNLTKQNLSKEVFAALVQLAEESGLKDARAAQFSGEKINISEDRAVLHTALRAPLSARPKSVAALVEDSRANLHAFADAIRCGKLRGLTGKCFTSVVHIGIGGSHLGPELVTSALEAYPHEIDLHYVANIDGHAIDQVLKKVNPETTLFIVVSKTFTTLETRANADAARSWFLERTGEKEAISQHFCAVSTNVSAAQEFGINAEQIFPIWDWVGGRYSLWSAVGLPILITYGPETFDELLAGAHALDQHFLEAPLTENLPVLMALAGVWNINFQNINNLGILAYDQRLRLFPDYLQQLEMESNGKSVHWDNTPVDIHTMAILWGGVETNGQHAFHQLLHQGTTSFTADFIAAVNPSHTFEEQHTWLLASCLSQSEAFLVGKEAEPHRQVVGNHPTTTILIDQLNPFNLGYLLALYEQKVFCQGVIWQINSFDQWGVELGKVLAEQIHDDLQKPEASGHDLGTRQLITSIKKRRTANE